jgi:hypothetical protein
VKNVMLCLSLALLAALMGCGRQSNPAAETAAMTAAQAWLAQVDAVQYGESWDQAAQIFRGAVSREHWIQVMQSTRAPLGTNLSRKLVTKQYRTMLPGAPDGEYVVIIFASSFQNKQSAVETITPMLDKDGTWRVSGYYMK